MRKLILLLSLVLPATVLADERAEFTPRETTWCPSGICVGDLTLPATGYLKWGTTRSKIGSSADGLITLLNATGTDFGRLNFGGTTAAFPALKRSLTGLQVRLADDSGYGSMTALNLYSTGQVSAGTNSSIYWSTRASMSSPADGKVKIGINNDTSGAVLDFSTADTLKVRNYADNAYGLLISGGLTLTDNMSVSSAGFWTYSSPQTSDTNARTITKMSGNAYWAASTAAKQAGGNLGLYGGIGSRVITITDKANSAGDQITFTVNGTATGKVAGTDWVCAAAASNAECACNLYTLLTSSPISGMTVTRTDGTCSDAKVGVVPTAASTYSLSVTITDNVGGQLGTVLSGANGQVIVTAGTGTAPGLALGEPTTGIGSAIPYVVSTVVGSTEVARFGTSQLAFYKPFIFTGGTSKNQLTTTTAAVQSVTFAGGGGAASGVTSGLIPRGAAVKQIVGRVTTTGTTCTSFTVGVDYGAGLDADMIGAGISPAANTTFTPATATADWVQGCYKVGGCEVTITATGGNCVNLVVAITAFYDTGTAPTNN